VLSFTRDRHGPVVNKHNLYFVASVMHIHHSQWRQLWPLTPPTTSQTEPLFTVAYRLGIIE